MHAEFRRFWQPVLAGRCRSSQKTKLISLFRNLFGSFLGKKELGEGISKQRILILTVLVRWASVIHEMQWRLSLSPGKNFAKSRERSVKKQGTSIDDNYLCIYSTNYYKFDVQYAIIPLCNSNECGVIQLIPRWWIKGLMKPDDTADYVNVKYLPRHLLRYWNRPNSELLF